MGLTMKLLPLIAGVFFIFTIGTGAQAQDGCKVVNASCSQMNARCERNCQNNNNPSACIARACSVNLTSCQANGIWQPRGGAACWRTNSRS